MTSINSGALAVPVRRGQWPDWDLRVVRPADARAVVLSVAAGAAFDTAIRSGVVSLGGALAVLVAAAALALSGRLETAASRMCAGTAALLGGFLVLRTSPWLIPFDVLAIAVMLALAAMLARDGRLSDLSAALLGSRVVLAVVHSVGSMAFLLDPPLRWLRHRDTMTQRRVAARAVGGVLLAAPVVAVLALLLASADRIFASVISVDVGLSPEAAGHLVLITLGTGGFGALLRLASARPSAPMPAVAWRLGTIEWTILFGSVAALLGTFAVVQAVAMAGGGRAVLETEGLTYAEHARTGYFQLLAVTMLVGALLVVVGPLCERSGDRTQVRFVALASLTLGLTGLVLVVAVHRLALYEDAYGWTMLRLMAKAGAVWIAAVLVMLGLRTAGVGRDRAWFLPATAGVGIALLLALNVVNPEAAVVRHNLARAEAGHEVDGWYLATLSDDAVPALVARLDALPEGERAKAVDGLCTWWVRSGEATTLLEWNRSSARADAALARLCPPTPG